MHYCLHQIISADKDVTKLTTKHKTYVLCSTKILADKAKNDAVIQNTDP